MGVRGLPTEFATRRSQSGSLETRAKLAKTRLDAGRGAGLIGARYVAIRLVVLSRRNLGGASAR